MTMETTGSGVSYRGLESNVQTDHKDYVIPWDFVLRSVRNE